MFVKKLCGLLFASMCFVPAAYSMLPVGLLIGGLFGAATAPHHENVEQHGYPLHEAVVNRDAMRATQLLAMGVQINRPNMVGATPLMEAARVGNAAVVRQLLDSGAQTNARDNLGETALVYAARANHLEVVRILVHHGADVLSRADSGLLASEIAHNPAIRRFLIGIERMAHLENRIWESDSSEDEGGRRGRGRHARRGHIHPYGHVRHEARGNDVADGEIRVERQRPAAAAYQEAPAGQREQERFNDDLALAQELSRREYEREQIERLAR